MLKMSSRPTTLGHNARWSQRFRTAALFTIVLTLFAHSARAQFQDLVRRVPGTANTLAVFNVDKMLQSPLAVREGWKEKRDKAFEAGLMFLPPDASRVILASQLDFEFMEPIWEISLMDLNTVPSMDLFARKHGVKMEMMDELPVVALPTDVYVVKFASRTVGAMSPGNRQHVARWVRECRSKSTVTLSPYLKEAVGYADDVGTEIVMALDLEYVLHPNLVREKLKGSTALAGKNVDLDELSKVIASVKGIMLGIRIGDKPFGKIKVDFGLDVSMTADYAKPLLLEALGKRGAMIHDLNDWKVVVEGKRISIEGYLSEGGMRRVFSVFHTPAPAPKSSDQKPEKPEFVSPGEQSARKASSSLQYFKSVTAMSKDLKRDMRDSKTLAQSAVWFDKYARRIDRLPLLDVDTDLLDWGGYVSHQLRTASGSVRTMGIQSSARSAQVTSGDAAPYAYGGARYGRYGRYGGYGGARGYAVYSPAAEARGIDTERRAIRAQERGAMATDVNAIRGQIATATADIRRTMTERYRIEF